MATKKTIQSKAPSRRSTKGLSAPGPQVPLFPHDVKGPKWNAERRAAFLGELSRGCSVGRAAFVAGISYKHAYFLRNTDPEFAADWDDAVEQGTDAIEDEARRRAVEGVQKPDYYQGEVVGYTTHYSDNILLSMLAARRPHKWKRGDVNISVSEPVSGIRRKIITPDGVDITDQVEDAEVVDGTGD